MTGRSTGQWSYFRPLGLPVDRTQVFDLLVDSSVDRGKNQRALLFGQSTGPQARALCMLLCTSVDHSVDRPLVRLTDRSTARSPRSGFKGFETWSFKTLKFYLNPIKSTKISSLKYFKVQICVIKSQQILQTCELFLRYGIYFFENHTFVCVCVCKLEHSTTDLFFTFI